MENFQDVLAVRGDALPDELRHCVPALVLGLVPVEFLAAALGLGTIKSVHARLTRDPSTLPAVTRLPGNRRIYFRFSDVQEWISAGRKERKAGQLQDDQSTPEVVRRGRGRPRKTGGTAK